MGQSIFRIPDTFSRVFVTQAFVDRVREHDLQGFHFVTLWPLPEGVSWEQEDKKSRGLETKIKIKAAIRAIKGNTVVLMFPTVEATPSAAEKQRLSQLMDELDAIFAKANSKKNYLGSLEGDDGVKSELRLFLSCPDADALVEHLAKWRNTVSWKDAKILKRYGEITDPDCKEKYVPF